MYTSSFLESCVAPHTSLYDSFSEISKRVIFGNSISVEFFPLDKLFSVALENDSIDTYRVNFPDDRRRRDEAAALISWFAHVANKTKAPITDSLLQGTILPSWLSQLAPFDLDNFHMRGDAVTLLSNPADFLQCGLSHLCDVSISLCTDYPHAAMASYGDYSLVLAFDVRKRILPKGYYIGKFSVEIRGPGSVSPIVKETGRFVTPFHILSDIWDFRHFAIEHLPITKEAWNTYRASTER